MPLLFPPLAGSAAGQKKTSLSQLPVVESVEHLIHGSSNKGDDTDAGGFQHALHRRRHCTADEDMRFHFPNSGGPADGIFPNPDAS